MSYYVGCRRLSLFHLQVPELYYLLFGLALGQPMQHVGAERAVSVERVWAAAWGGAAPSRTTSAAVAARVSLCPEAVVILLATARALVHAEPDTLPDWLADHPVSIIQVRFPLFINHYYFLSFYRINKQPTKVQLINKNSVCLFSIYLIDIWRRVAQRTDLRLLHWQSRVRPQEMANVFIILVIQTCDV